MNGARYEQAVLGRFYETVVARWMAIVWQHGHLTWITNASGPDDPHRAAAVRRAQVHLGRADAGPGDAAGRRLRPGADRHLLGGRQLQPRGRVVRLGAPRDGHRRRLRGHRSGDRRRRRPAPTLPDRSARRHRAPAATSRSATAPAGPCSRAPICRPRPARPCTCTAIPAPASRRWCGCWPACGRSRAASSPCPTASEVMITPQKSYLPLGSLKGALLYPDPDAADVRRPAAGPRSTRSTWARSAPGSTRWRAGTRCSPTASASGSPSPGC